MPFPTVNTADVPCVLRDQRARVPEGSGLTRFKIEHNGSQRWTRYVLARDRAEAEAHYLTVAPLPSGHPGPANLIVTILAD